MKLKIAILSILLNILQNKLIQFLLFFVWFLFNFFGVTWCFHEISAPNDTEVIVGLFGLFVIFVVNFYAFRSYYNAFVNR